jgi:hypothetical protein
LLKLLLEHLSPDIAPELPERGHDIVNDVRPLIGEGLRRGETTYGLVRVAGRFRLNRDVIGRLVRALDALMLANPGVDAAATPRGEVWLRNAADG